MQTQDFNRMQAQAIKHAYDMQRRATIPEAKPHVQINPSTEKKEPPPEIKENKKQNTAKQFFPNINDIFSRHNPWTHEQQTPFCQNACPIKNILGIGNDSNSGSDVMTLMAIMMLLSTDGGDRMLMLALLYIMT